MILRSLSDNSNSRSLGVAASHFYLLVPYVFGYLWLCDGHGIWKVICRNNLRCRMEVLSPEDWHLRLLGTLGHSQPRPPESTFKAWGSLNDRVNHGAKFAQFCFLFVFVLRVELTGVPAYHERGFLLKFLPRRCGRWDLISLQHPHTYIHPGALVLLEVRD